MAAYNVKITSAVYANARGTIVSVLLNTGETWMVPPGNGSGQANVLDQWVRDGGNIGPYVPPVPGGAVPVGSFIWSASSRTPSGWLPCDGSEVKRLQYPLLFSAIGTIFGGGNGTTTFNVPDLTAKFIRGWGPVNNFDPNRQFATDQGDLIRAHYHGITDPGHTHGVIDPGHVHPVMDPGHSHGVTDPGHAHDVSDPGHYHIAEQTEIGYFPLIARENPPVVMAPFGYTPAGGSFNITWVSTSADLTVVSRSAGVGVAEAAADLSDIEALTNISVDPSVTGLQLTDFDGGYESRPANVSLLPYIKY